MKIWSSHLLDNLSNCLMKIQVNQRDSNTALHITFLSYDIPFTGKHERNKLTCSPLCDFIAKKCYMQWGVWNQMKIWSSHLLDNLSNCLMKNSGDSTDSNTALHITFLSYDIPFTGKHEPNKLTCSPLCDFIAQLVRALHQHRRGHGFESRWVTWIFQVHETIIA